MLHSVGINQVIDDMLKRHKIGDAPAWQRRLMIFIGGLMGATLLLFAAWAVLLFINWNEVDDCLDQGGSYNYDLEQCDFNISHPKS